MIIDQDVSIGEYTTFGVSAKASYFTSLASSDDVLGLIADPLWRSQKHYVLGGGSNTLFRDNFDGLVVHNAIMGREIIEENNETVTIRLGAGEDWHQFVMWSVAKGYWGIENLALIPGTVGASVVQNIGAYGVEVQKVVVSVELVNTKTKKLQVFDVADCKFAYRDSIFKQESGVFIVTAVTYRLSKNPEPHLEYPAIQERVLAKGYSCEDPRDVAHAVIDIRRSKLPDVGEIGMAGSFFKNPIVSREHFAQLQKRFPNISGFAVEGGSIKVSAGWIIEELGYKGIREGNVGTYHRHALVLVNYGGASGEEVWSFAQKIMQHAKEVYNIDLEPEVLIV